jgi:hypothetical protein
MCITVPNNTNPTDRLRDLLVNGNGAAVDVSPEEDVDLASFLCSFDQDGDFSAVAAGTTEQASRDVDLSSSTSMIAYGAATLNAPHYAFEHFAGTNTKPVTDNQDLTSLSSCAAPPSQSQRYKRRRRKPQPPGKTATDKERLFVKHNYHDLDNEPDMATEDTNDESKLFKRLSADAFPLKLHRVLSAVEDDGLGHILSWQPHGRAFLIHSNKDFVSTIIPRYFPKMSKLTSIQRQLNLYGFERLTKDGPDLGAYYHEAFLRGREELSACRMVRQRVKGTGYKATSNPEDEPDFYKMPFVTSTACNSVNTKAIGVPEEKAVSFFSTAAPALPFMPPQDQVQAQYESSHGVTQNTSSLLSWTNSMATQLQVQNNQELGTFGNIWQAPSVWNQGAANVRDQMAMSQQVNNSVRNDTLISPTLLNQPRLDLIPNQDYGPADASLAAFNWNENSGIAPGLSSICAQYKSN